ncbi:tRNA (N(6)-L-threonylcarbamoyladenosine(37)-C(2))-methylthiotransferase MtaB [Chloroflexota bacterium]
MIEGANLKGAVFLETLGCKLNQAETEELAGELAREGYRLVTALKEADIYILNTCTVTGTADAKSRQRLRLVQRRNPKALLVAVGCYAQRAGEELADIDGVKLLLGNEDKMKLSQLLQEMEYTERPVKLQAGGYNPKRSRALIKAQDGCNSFCAYCIVPLVRGKPKSLHAEQIITTINEKIRNGYGEAVLTGTEIGSYSRDGLSLKGLLEAILNRTQIERLRLSSLQPHHITPQLIGLWQNPRLCPHFHLSLQSGSDDVLKRMRRCYLSRDYKRVLSLIRSLLPDAAITTDVIVGFPGESEAEFERSYNFCRRMGFSRIHVFPFSARPDTPAAEMPDKIDDAIKKQRSRKMMALAEESATNFRRRFLGRVMPVLWEQKKKSIWSGLTDNYIRVYTGAKEDLNNRITRIKLEKLYKDGVWGVRQE